jgi:hypothetical protein
MEIWGSIVTDTLLSLEKKLRWMTTVLEKHQKKKK